ncbi:hypothetical protein FOMPIDRAFT_117606 [Fomitopsis schrenkii]|uniref:Uncharacterized protein n=1 Tax=Fomitopsis schrenkii TaxID=2126942 RepID=S8F5R5_FOMSC|nr:hypothetical protein FOMPIDRAFT_117606 [Fomitopsis schrenkii]
MDHNGMRKHLEDIIAGMGGLQDPSDRRREETRCFKMLYDWFTVLWQLGVEKARHRKTDVIPRITAHRDEKGERLPDPSLTLKIERTNGKSLETAPGGDDPREALAWMWLELLTGSTVEYSEAEETFIKGTIAALPPTSLRVVGRLFQDRVARKGRAPSLLEVTRQKLRGNMRSRVLRMGWRAAAMVFCECGMPSDFWSLSKALATVPMDDDVLGALLAMAGHPKADFTLPGEDTMAALLFKVALRCAVSSCWLRIAQHYPGWDRAWDWLDDAVQDGTLSAQIPPDATTKQKADRSLSVAKFGKLLGPGAKPKSAAGTDVPSPSVAGQKRSLDEAIGAGADDWGRARDVRKCLDVLRGSRFTTREAVDVPAVAEYALGSHYLATIEGIFNIIHESFVIISAPDQSTRKALVALRDVLRDQWDVSEPPTSLPSSDTPESGAASSKRPAKARRVESAK